MAARPPASCRCGCPHAALITIYWDLARPVRLPLPIIPCVNASDHRFGGFGVKRMALTNGSLVYDSNQSLGDVYAAVQHCFDASLSPNPPMDGARIAEGGEEVTDATVRARIRVDWRLAGGLSALLGVLIAACDGCGERDGGIGHGKKHSRTGPGASWRGS